MPIANIEDRRQWDRDHREKTVRKAREIKLAVGCSICGYKAHHAALEFHHRDPATKKFRVADGRNYSLKAVLLEIEKCDVVCSNCHRVLEYEFGKSNRERKRMA